MFEWGLAGHVLDHVDCVLPDDVDDIAVWRCDVFLYTKHTGKVMFDMIQLFVVSIFLFDSF